MYDNNYGLDRRLKSRWVGLDLATGGGEGHDFSALSVIDQYEQKNLKDAFSATYENQELFMITELLRTRELNLDLQIEYFREIIEKLGNPKPTISVDASRELGFTLNLRSALPEHIINACVWTGGARIEKEGRKYNVSKTAAWRGVKGMISLGWLTVAPGLELKDELIREIRTLVLEESESGECRVKTSGTGHDDIASSLAIGMIPTLQRNILERRQPRVVPNFLSFTDKVKK